MPTHDMSESQLALLHALEFGHVHKIVAPFVREHGQFYEPAPLPKGIRRGRAQACYENSYRPLKRHGKRLWLVYVEGYAIYKGTTPIKHAWCTDATGAAYDRTWPSGLAYYGVPFCADYVFHAIQQRHQDGGNYYGFLDDWPNDWQLILELGDQPELWKHPASIT
jgi:hypothetical protein